MATRRFPSSAASWRAAIKLAGSAMPLPAMSYAVPWSGDVRTIGSPSVTLTPRSHVERLQRDQRLVMVHADCRIIAAARPRGEHRIWWPGPRYIDASRAQCVNRGSDDRTLPRRRVRPALPHADSVRRWQGAAAQYRTRAAMPARWFASPATIASVVSMAIELRSEACTVTGTTRSSGLASIMICRPVAPVSAARNSVWPG